MTKLETTFKHLYNLAKLIQKTLSSFFVVFPQKSVKSRQFTSFNTHIVAFRVNSFEFRADTQNFDLCI